MQGREIKYVATGFFSAHYGLNSHINRKFNITIYRVMSFNRSV